MVVENPSWGAPRIHGELRMLGFDVSERTISRWMRRAPRTSFGSPWQNGVAERWVASCRRDLLDHIIAVNERHLKRLLSEYIHYYHDDRTHLGLGKGTPNYRIRSMTWGRVLAHERLGGFASSL
jgi:transposase InsO family protein